MSEIGRSDPDLFGSSSQYGLFRIVHAVGQVGETRSMVTAFLGSYRYIALDFVDLVGHYSALERTARCRRKVADRRLRTLPSGPNRQEFRSRFLISHFSVISMVSVRTYSLS
jgi:hypothetical protein